MLEIAGFGKSLDRMSPYGRIHTPHDLHRVGALHSGDGSHKLLSVWFEMTQAVHMCLARCCLQAVPLLVPANIRSPGLLRHGAEGGANVKAPTPVSASSRAISHERHSVRRCRCLSVGCKGDPEPRAVTVVASVPQWLCGSLHRFHTKQ